MINNVRSTSVNIPTTTAASFEPAQPSAVKQQEGDTHLASASEVRESKGKSIAEFHGLSAEVKKNELVGSAFGAPKAKVNAVDIVDLLPTDPMFKKISAYLMESAASASVTAPPKEATRMRRAKALLDSPDATALQKSRAKLRLKEGEFGGASLVKSGKIDIVGIQEVRNPAVDKKYNDYKKMLANEIPENAKTLKKIQPTTHFFNEGLDAHLGEVFLLHSCTKDMIDVYAKHGFKPEYNPNKGTPEKPRYGALGQGTYFSDSIGKVMTYSVDPESQDYDPKSQAEHSLLLCQVALGIPKKKRSYLQNQRSLRADDVNKIKEGRHSVVSQGLSNSWNPATSSSLSNEFLVKKGDAINAKYIIHWKHDNG